MNNDVVVNIEIGPHPNHPEIIDITFQFADDNHRGFGMPKSWLKPFVALAKSGGLDQFIDN